MDAASPERNETPTERLDRNWAELLQELRVILTGVQLLTGFLLTLPFTQRFDTVSHGEKGVYLVTVATSVGATVFLQAPVMVHRALFRRHRRAETVLFAHRFAIIGMALLGVALTGVSSLIVTTLADLTWGSIAAGAVFVLVVGMWIFLPLRVRRMHSTEASDAVR